MVRRGARISRVLRLLTELNKDAQGKVVVCIAAAACSLLMLGVSCSSDSLLGSIVLMIVYGYLLLRGAQLLSNGSELLLEVISPGIIGGELHLIFSQLACIPARTAMPTPCLQVTSKHQWHYDHICWAVVAQICQGVNLKIAAVSGRATRGRACHKIGCLGFGPTSSTPLAGLLLPILGALPDALIIVVSGLGGSKDEAAEQVRSTET